MSTEREAGTAYRVVQDVSRTYGTGPTAVQALSGVSFDVARGELLAVRGRSGSGKTTLLGVLGGLDRPTAGSVVLGGRDVTGGAHGGCSRCWRGTSTLARVTGPTWR